MKVFTQVAGPILATAMTITPLTASAQDVGTQPENTGFYQTARILNGNCQDITTDKGLNTCAAALAHQTILMAERSINAADQQAFVTSRPLNKFCVDNRAGYRENTKSKDLSVSTDAFLSYVNKCINYGYEHITQLQAFTDQNPNGAESAKNLFPSLTTDVSAIFNQQRYNLINLTSSVLSTTFFYPNGEYKAQRKQAIEMIQNGLPNMFERVPNQ